MNYASEVVITISFIDNLDMVVLVIVCSALVLKKKGLFPKNIM